MSEPMILAERAGHVLCATLARPPVNALDDALPAMLVVVEGDEDTTDYWVGLHNFRVITRYNRSVKYALAALELSEAIRQRYLQ